MYSRENRSDERVRLLANHESNVFKTAVGGRARLRPSRCKTGEGGGAATALRYEAEPRNELERERWQSHVTLPREGRTLPRNAVA